MLSRDQLQFALCPVCQGAEEAHANAEAHANTMVLLSGLRHFWEWNPSLNLQGRDLHFFSMQSGQADHHPHALPS
jgi:hypothetical protein